MPIKEKLEKNSHQYSIFRRARCYVSKLKKQSYIFIKFLSLSLVSALIALDPQIQSVDPLLTKQTPRQQDQIVSPLYYQNQCSQYTSRVLITTLTEIMILILVQIYDSSVRIWREGLENYLYRDTWKFHVLFFINHKYIFIEIISFDHILVATRSTNLQKKIKKIKLLS